MPDKDAGTTQEKDKDDQENKEARDEGDSDGSSPRTRRRRKRRRRAFSVRLQWHADTLAALREADINLPWDSSIERPVSSSIRVEELAGRVVSMFDRLYFEAYGEEVFMRVLSMSTPERPEDLPWDDYLDNYVDSGGAVVIKAYFMSISMIRKTLRFDLNDRVLCYCGERWLSGHIVGTAVKDDDMMLPYLVKTEPLPGMPSRTISVPQDKDSLCVQEVCFDTDSQLDLIKASTPTVPNWQQSKLRFAVGDEVACRVQNASDGLETWKLGRVHAIWPELPGDRSWELGGVCGEYAEVAPYKVELLEGKSIFCQADKHTLIRRSGMEPQTRVKGLSKRMEIRQTEDGGKERVDHVTERRKRLLECASDSE